MKRTHIAGLLAILIVAVAATIAFAATGPVEDAYVRSTSPTSTYNDTFLSLYANGSGCAAQDYFLVKFNVGPNPGNIGRATLTLTTAANSSGVTAGQTKLSLYQASNAWTEATLTYNLAQTLVGTELTPSVDAPSTSNATVVFGNAAASSTLSAYLAEQPANSDVSIAVKLSGVCSNATSAVRFASSENTTYAGPSLELFTPTAVDMSAASAQQTTSWPLYAGLAAVVILVAAGVTITRRRTA